MKRTTILERTLVGAAALLALASGCDGNHVLGTADGGHPGGNPGTAGAAGATSATSGEAGSIITAPPGSSGTAATDGGTAVDGATRAAGAPAMADPATLGPPETWTGYVEGKPFPSGSSAIVLTFAADANGVVKGTVVFGMGTPPPPATDPNVGYPPDLFSGPDRPTAGGFIAFVEEGYRYAFDGGSLAADRLQISVNMQQLWTAWCALQTPTPDGSGACISVPPGAVEQFDSAGKTCLMDGNQWLPVDCGKLALCQAGGVCSCTSSGCGLSPPRAVFTTLDVFLTGNTAGGSARVATIGLANVHFVKN